LYTIKAKIPEVPRISSRYFRDYLRYFYRIIQDSAGTAQNYS
jgi:hypothetical protein